MCLPVSRCGQGALNSQSAWVDSTNCEGGVQAEIAWAEISTCVVENPNCVG